MVEGVGITLRRGAVKPVGCRLEILRKAPAFGVQRTQPLVRGSDVLLSRLGEPARRLGRIVRHSLAREIELPEKVLRLTVTEIRRLPAEERRSVQVSVRTRAKEVHERQTCLEISARRGAAQPGLGFRSARRDADAAPVQLAEVEHRGRLARLGRLGEETRRALLVVLYALTEKEQHRETQLRGGVASRRARFEPALCGRVVGSPAVAAGEKHAEAELTRRVLLLRRGTEPAFGFLEIACPAEPARVLVAEARLSGRIARVRRTSIPVGRLLEILRHGKALRIQPLQERSLVRLLVDPLQRRGRRRVGRCESGKVDFPKSRHRGNRALLGGAPEPAHRLDEVLQDPFATLVQLAEAQLRLRHATFRECPKHRRGVRLAAGRIRRLSALERRGTLERRDFLE